MGKTSSRKRYDAAFKTKVAVDWITAPGCYVDIANMLATVAPELFLCFVPGQVAPGDIDPSESCMGSFYDPCAAETRRSKPCNGPGITTGHATSWSTPSD